MSVCPFGGIDEAEITKKILKGEYYFSRSFWSDISTEAKDFISNLLVEDVGKRLTAAGALDHPWIKGSEVIAEHALSDECENHMFHNMREFRKYSDLKRAAMLAIAFTLSDDDINEMRKLFQMTDVDRSGLVSKEEFINILHKHGIMDNSECQRIFESIDQDHSSTITYTEYLAACVDEKRFVDDARIVDAFNRLDADQSGVISKQNLRTLFGSGCKEEAIDRMLKDADFNNDGIINIDEFRRVMAGERATGLHIAHEKQPDGQKKRPSIC
jgi:calcium-dependent protein kinase